MRKLLDVVVAAVVALTPVGAMAARVTVTDPWVRALPGNAAGYFILRNDDDNPIVLTGAQTTSCGAIMMHKTSSDGGMASMSDVDKVTLAPHEIVKFAPGGYHLMCMNPKAEVAPGKRVTILLMFADGTGNPVAFAVRNAAGH